MIKNIVNTKYLRSQQGFSFIELLVVISLISVVASLAAQIFFINLKTVAKTENIKEVKQSGDYALAMMESTIRNATSVVACGTNLQSLTVREGNNKTTTFNCNSGRITTTVVENGNTNSGSLLSNNVRLPTKPAPAVTGVPNCTFQVICPSNNPAYVVVDFKVVATSSASTVDKKAEYVFTSTTSLRQY